MASIPPKYTTITDWELNTPTPTTEETVRKMIQNMEMIKRLNPLGHVAMIALEHAGVSLPNSNYQFCDGSNGSIDLRDKYMRTAPDVFTGGNTGAATIDLSHNHGGSTGEVCNDLVLGIGTFIPDFDRTINTMKTCHAHSIATDLTTPVPLDPPHRKVAWFQKK